MKKFIPYILMAWLSVGFSLLTLTKVLSQENQKENQPDTANNITTMTDGDSPAVKGITTGRARALAGVVVGLISLGIGWQARIRSTRGTSNGRTGAIVALVLGLIGIILSVVHLSITTGAVFGSGSGKAGAIVALVLGLIGITLGGMAFRSRNIN
jgi:hypothetical protein